MSERKHEMEIRIDATPEDVWEAISTGEGFRSWFAPIARVEPGVGGQISMGWAPEMEFATRIEIWEPGRHLRTASDRGEGAPPTVVDYFIESRGGSTVLRLVQSGFGATANFDDEYEATGAAWPAFLQMMKHSVERGVAACRNVTVFRMLGGTPADVWSKLVGTAGLGAEGLRIADERLEGVVRYAKPGACCCIELAGGEMLSIFCDKCGGDTMLTITWLLYDVPEEKADALRLRWSALMDILFGRPATA